MNVSSTHKRIGAGIIAAVIALSPIAMMAEGHEGRGGGIRDAAVVIQSLEAHQVTFPQLIEAAEAAGKGVAIGIEVEGDVALQGIEVTLLRDNEVLKVNCSPLTGEVIKVGSPEIIHSAIARISKRYDSLKNAKISLLEAVIIAEKAEQGIAYRAHVEDMDNWVCYEINVMFNGNPVRVIIDPESGRIVGRDTGNNRHHDGH
ncbi:MAG: PepSY domain-containing protein [Pseudodesulfovibrio sp.]